MVSIISGTTCASRPTTRSGSSRRWASRGTSSWSPTSCSASKDGGGVAGDTAAKEIPTKCVVNTLKLQIKAQVHYIDFEGRSDGESIHKCLMQIKPRSVIIVRGSVEDGTALAEFCIPLLAKNVANEGHTGHDGGKDLSAAAAKARVFTPKNGETVDATTESHIYQVRLPDSLMSGLAFHQGKDDTLLAWVDGRIAFKQQNQLVQVTSAEPGESSVINQAKDGEPYDGIRENNLNEANKEEDKRLIPSLEPLSREQDIVGHQTSFVNELKLSDFKIVLSKHNIASEFQGGVLFCGANNIVALRRHDSGRVTIEGTVCEDYYLVRSLLYERYAIV